MSVQLLDKTRKINKLLHNNYSSKVVFNDICAVLTEILDSNVLVVSRKGKILGVSKSPDVQEISELITEAVGSHIDQMLNERLLSILSTKENDYVAAARVIGNSNGRIIFHHILPNIVSSIVVRATLGISTAILDTAALDFLGLGVQPPTAEWGDMLGRVRSMVLVYPHMLIFPGLAITLAVLAFNLFGDGLRDALDPKSRS